jgi:hypothetical protein
MIVIEIGDLAIFCWAGIFSVKCKLCFANNVTSFMLLWSVMKLAIHFVFLCPFVVCVDD